MRGIKYAFIAVVLLAFGFFIAGNTDVITRTFFPEEKMIARISLGGKSEETAEKEKIVNSPEEISKSEICSFIGSSINPIGPISSIGPVVLNEIAWMGDGESFSNEWIELKNISTSDVDIFGWRILDQDEQIKIVFVAKEIGSGEFLVLRRGEDFSGNLRNSEEGLRLFDKGCNLIDEAFASPDWPAGDNKSKFTMERSAADFSWYTASVAGGTPNGENSAGAINPTGSVNPISPISPTSQADQAGKININTAGYEELQKITGVGPVIAGRIIEYRNLNGPFRRIEDLKDVKGIGEVTFEKMKDEISI
ncbi:hypothetical protein A2127_02300 [Candidatus Jorgensenbacteria bacterium GWC1_48_12]|uniref:LTD domain-containing protein n=1 Tax=Candidatus Jorgensenbacteria bacterium GWC1_48_12 TaxID=1798469 RepID=A0A1F6BM19_9BACT|nr:MAG: hypothetical protein A2127_02300 [Candidatus Jorgensenbacteria bacterium GWC1_48_12]